MFMRVVVLVAVLMVVIGAASESGFFDRFTAPGAVNIVAADHTPPEPAGPVVLAAADNGHYFVDASVSGRPVRFVVDTGASLVVLSAETARRLNLKPAPGEFVGQSRTANGVVAFAPVRLPEIRIGSIRLANVDAAILPEGATDTDLLGMSFLKRLRSFQSSGRQMILTP